VQENKAPASAYHKAEIQNWLTNILTQTLQNQNSWKLQNLILSPTYRANKILQEKGFTALKRPSYHCDLNPTELIWGILKQKIATKNVGNVSLTSLKEMTRKANIINADWAHVCSHVKKPEDKYWHRDLV
jgi:hypothetical protein